MSDEIDLAQQKEQERRSDALKKRKAPGPSGGGECLYCGDRLPITRRWCNAEHRDLWEEEQRRAMLAGDGLDE